MCMFSPKIPDPLKPPAAPPLQVDAALMRSGQRERRASGRASTILTSGQGLGAQANTGKTILGG